MNFQNLPNHDDRAGRLKKAIVPKLDAFLFADFKAMEFRIAAYLLAAQPTLKDFAFIREIERGEDPHENTARMIYGREPTKTERDRAKTTMFSMLYSGTWRTILRQGVVQTPEEAQSFVTEFHRARPQIGKLNACVKRVMEERGFVRTLWGRKLTGNPEMPLWKRPMVNYLIQGTGAEIMKDALINTGEFLNRGLYDSHLVLTIHDELILDCSEAEIPSIVDNLPQLMSNEKIAKFLPLGIDVAIGRTSWADEEEYKPEPARELVAAGDMNGQPLSWED